MSAINLRTNHLVTHTHTHTHTTWIQIWSCSIVNFVSIGGQCFNYESLTIHNFKNENLLVLR